MFIIDTQYTAPIKEVDKFLVPHIEWLREGYGKGQFITSGRKIPCTGYIVLAKMTSRDQVEILVATDPLVMAGVARSTLTQFDPTSSVEMFSYLLGGDYQGQPVHQ